MIHRTKLITYILMVIIILMLIAGFWGERISSMLLDTSMVTFYLQLAATVLGATLGIPVGLYRNRKSEENTDRRIVSTILTFIKVELESNRKYIIQLQSSAETLNSIPTLSKDDLQTFNVHHSVLKQVSYIAAQTSVAFASSNNDVLLTHILNAYLEIQRLKSGSMALNECDPGEAKTILISYIKLCERAKESIRLCIPEIDETLRKNGRLLKLLE